MSQATTTEVRRRRPGTTYLLSATPDQLAELKQIAEAQGITMRALLLHRTLGIPLDDPTLDSTPGRKVPRPQQELPMTG